METSKNSKSSFSLREKVGMRGLKSIIYNPSPLPEGEGIFRDSLIASNITVSLSGESRHYFPQFNRQTD
jgi:hypothetical protein